MFRNIIVRLVVYYLSLLLFLAAAFAFLPQVGDLVSEQRDRFLVGALTDAGEFGTAMFEDLREGFARLIDQDGIDLLIDPSNTIPVFVALTLAFALALPVTWVYRWTREPKKYSQSFLHALLVTPDRHRARRVPGQGQPAAGLRPRGNRGRRSLPGHDQGTDGRRIHVDGHRDRTLRRHPAHLRGLPVVDDIRGDSARRLEERLRIPATRAVRVAGRARSVRGGAEEIEKGRQGDLTMPAAHG